LSIVEIASPDMLRMKSVYRYRKERHFAQPPEAIWPFVADSARINEIAGMPACKVEEQADAQQARATGQSAGAAALLRHQRERQPLGSA
jgi:hypothetical protein